MPEPLEFHVRRAKQEDAELIRRVQRAAVEGLCAGDYTPDQVRAWTDYTAQDFADGIASGGLYLVAQAGDEVVGFICLRAAEVVSLYVLPDCVRQGVGRALLREVEVQAVRRMVGELRLNSSLSSLGFYERCGFREVERGTYHTASGVDLPCVRMAKRLGSW